MHRRFPYLTLALLLSSAALAGCSDNLIGASDSNEVYLGRPGTTRTYRGVRRHLEPGTLVPYVVVPEPFRGRSSFSEAQLADGVVAETIETEWVRPLRETWVSAHRLSLIPHPEGEYRSVLQRRRWHSLEEELLNFAHDPSYHPGPWAIDGGSYSEDDRVWREGGDVVEALTFVTDTVVSTEVRVRTPLAVGAEWVVSERTYRADNGQAEVIREEARVVSQEWVSVAAGEFLAYKVAQVIHWVDLGTQRIGHHEYYAPGVGLVLRENDYETIRRDGNVSERYRVVERRELSSYSVVAN